MQNICLTNSTMLYSHETSDDTHAMCQYLLSFFTSLFFHLLLPTFFTVFHHDGSNSTIIGRPQPLCAVIGMNFFMKDVTQQPGPRPFEKAIRSFGAGVESYSTSLQFHVCENRGNCGFSLPHPHKVTYHYLNPKVLNNFLLLNLHCFTLKAKEVHQKIHPSSSFSSDISGAEGGWA